MWHTSGGHPHACEGLWVVGSQLSGALAMVAVLLLPKQLGWQHATHKHQYPAWTSCVPASSPGCAAGTRQDLLTGLARALQALLKPTAPEWKRLPLCNDHSSGKLVRTGACSVAASYKPPMLVTRAQLPACAFHSPRLRGRGACGRCSSARLLDLPAAACLQAHGVLQLPCVLCHATESWRRQRSSP